MQLKNVSFQRRTTEPGIERSGPARVLDFFVVARTLGGASIGILALALGRIMKRGRTGPPAPLTLGVALLCGVAGLAFSFAITLPEAIVHHQPYGSLLLILFAGAGAAAMAPLWLGAGITLASGCYMLWVWLLPPLQIADRIQGSGLMGAAAGACLVIVACIRAGEDDSA